MPNRLHRHLALSLSLFCLSPLARAEDKQLVKPAAIAATAEQALPPLSADEMKAAGESATSLPKSSVGASVVRPGHSTSGALFDTIDQVHALGLHYLEAYPGQMVDKDKALKMEPSMTPETMAAIKQKLADNDIHLGSFGVTGIPGDEAGCTQVLRLGKGHGAGDDRLRAQRKPVRPAQQAG